MSRPARLWGENVEAGDSSRIPGTGGMMRGFREAALSLMPAPRRWDIVGEATVGHVRQQSWPGYRGARNSREWFRPGFSTRQGNESPAEEKSDVPRGVLLLRNPAIRYRNQMNLEVAYGSECRTNCG
ncbi:hypothetical protein Sfum_2967 [Syntrophobacter fumaroxidans MPOB]|uniref:Uncharacterized protein n=1 Tax=Syntrophobacter fumaroxidans (strain DSM 10017 / MPOB) TaxID=335543 RepID=A0LMI9_SYNFM|nr:hypothetical protein Sfum_2967 [Syntrophobacter fumaroxidans MPOB]